jgi:DNA invertase Pin-like site-specific DNA recombinase
MTMRAALYHRVSTADQDATNARDELRAAAARMGAQVVLDVEETGSGARNDRPGLAQVMTAVRRGKVDVVLVWKLDRFGRSSLDLLANIEAITGAGARFVAVTQGLDIKSGGDAMSKLMLTMLAAVAEFERDLIKERTRLGVARARERGAKLGRPSSGVDAARVRELRAGGASWAQVGAELGCHASAARRAVA